MNSDKRDRIFYVLQVCLFMVLFSGLGIYIMVSQWEEDNRWIVDHKTLTGIYVGLVVLNCLGLAAFGHPGYRPEKNKKPPG